ncbi:unnamed protein product [Rhizophagus irregularis]|nr:unnamed protein product [Rhizophagus irregularis]
MKKFIILTFIIFIILLQIVHEVQPRPQAPPAGGLPTPDGGLPTPAGGLPTPAGGLSTPAGGLPTPTGGLPTPAGDPLPPAGRATPAGGTPSGGTPITTGFTNLPSRSATPVRATPSTQSTGSASSDATSPLIIGGIVGGIVNGLILIFLACLCFFLGRKYGRNNEAIAIPGLNNNANRNNISNPGVTSNEIDDDKLLPTTSIDLVISNQGQEFTPNLPNYNNQQGTTRELGNIKQGNLSSYNIDENIIEQMKQDILRDIKQELKQNIRTKVMSSLVRDSNVEDDSSGSKNDNR